MHVSLMKMEPGTTPPPGPVSLKTYGPWPDGKMKAAPPGRRVVGYPKSVPAESRWKCSKCGEIRTGAEAMWWCEGGGKCRVTPAPATDSPAWRGDLSDDCTAHWCGLTLRAEDMGQGWWWAVYQGKDEIETGDEPDGATARVRAEASARRALATDSPELWCLSCGRPRTSDPCCRCTCGEIETTDVRPTDSPEPSSYIGQTAQNFVADKVDRAWSRGKAEGRRELAEELLEGEERSIVVEIDADWLREQAGEGEA
jgi:hypothetical protein